MSTPPTQHERILDLWRQIMRQQRKGTPSEWLEVDISMAQVKSMFVLLHGGPAMVTEVAEAVGVSVPSTTGTLDRLVKAGLVERRADAHDRRRVIHALTPAGLGLIERLQQGRRARLSAALERLDPSALATLEVGLTALAEALHETEPAATPASALEPAPSPVTP